MGIAVEARNPIQDLIGKRTEVVAKPLVDHRCGEPPIKKAGLSCTLGPEASQVPSLVGRLLKQTLGIGHVASRSAQEASLSLVADHTHVTSRGAPRRQSSICARRSAPSKSNAFRKSRQAAGHVVTSSRRHVGVKAVTTELGQMPGVSAIARRTDASPRLPAANNPAPSAQATTPRTAPGRSPVVDLERAPEAAVGSRRAQDRRGSS